MYLVVRSKDLVVEMALVVPAISPAKGGVNDASTAARLQVFYSSDSTAARLQVFYSSGSTAARLQVFYSSGSTAVRFPAVMAASSFKSASSFISAGVSGTDVMGAGVLGEA